MPAFALFFPAPVAVAATAVVHLANNIFKVLLVGRKADWKVVVRFALPGAIVAIFGALLLIWMADTAPLFQYQLGGETHEVTLVKVVIGGVIIVFAFFDLLPYFEGLAFERKYLPLSGLISGFLGGLSE